MADLNKSAINPATGKAWAVNPSTGQWDDNYFETVAKPQWYQSSPEGMAYKSTEDAFANAKRAQQMQIEANQPAIQRLTTHKTDLDSKYNDLLSSIGASENTAVDASKLSANNELARRGIVSNSGVGEAEMAKAIAPVTTNYAQLKAQTGLQRENDLTGLASQIAGLEAGNVPNSLNFASGLSSLQQQAQQIANQLALGRESNEIERMNAQNSGNNQQRYTTIGEGQTLWDLFGNQAIYTAPKTYKASGGGNNSY